MRHSSKIILIKSYVKDRKWQMLHSKENKNTCCSCIDGNVSLSSNASFNMHASARLLQTCLPSHSLFLPRCPDKTSISITVLHQPRHIFSLFLDRSQCTSFTPNPPSLSSFISPILLHYLPPSSIS